MADERQLRLSLDEGDRTVVVLFLLSRFKGLENALRIMQISRDNSIDPSCEDRCNRQIVRQLHILEWIGYQLRDMGHNGPEVTRYAGVLGNKPRSS